MRCWRVLAARMPVRFRRDTASLLGGDPGAGIDPKRMRMALPFQDTAVISHVPQKGCSFHERLTIS